jgi:PAS domain S-box-containing protein
MILVDEGGRIVLANAQAEKLFGYTAPELLGSSIDRLVPERFRGAHPGHRRSFFSDPRARAMGAGRDLFGLRKDGTEVPVEIGLNPIRTDQGSFVLAAVVDITERKRAEERFRLVVESAPNAMLMADDKGKIVLVNTQAERLFGYPRQELLQQSIDLLIPHRFRGHHPKHRADFQTDPRARPMGADRDLHAVRKDGVEIPVEIGLNPIRTAEGSYVLAAVVDISERKRTQQALEQKNEEIERLASIVEYSQDAILAATLDGIILTWNHGARRIFGLSQREALGKPLTQLIAPARAAEFAGILERSRREEAVDAFETVGNASDGRPVDLRISLSVIRNPSGAADELSIILRDITDMKKMQQELLRSQSLAAVGEMAATVAHEVKNPLAAISGPLQILAEDLPPGHPHKELMKEILGQVRRLDGTVRGLLAISKPTTLTRQTFIFREVAERVARLMVEHDSCRGIQIQVEGGEELPLSGDAALLEQVLWNLLLNSAEAMKAGGRIVVSLKEDAGDLVASITDSGAGIPPELLAKIFRPFVTTKRGGTGLGLPLCRKIVEAHGGAIDVSSQVGAGTTVRVRLPRS